jgi:outer membrane protein assembly factor BamB
MKDRSVPRGAILCALGAAFLGLASSPAISGGAPPALPAPPAIPGLRVVEEFGERCLRFPPITLETGAEGKKILLLLACHEGELKDYPSPVAPPMSGGGTLGNALRWERLTRACGNFNLVAALDGDSRKLLWKFAAGGLVERAFLSDGGKRLIFSSTDDTIYALDVATGAVAWKAPLEGGIEAMAVEGPVVAAVTAGNAAVGLSSSDGSALWRLPVKVPHVNPEGGWLKLRDGAAYLASMDNRVMAVDARTGEVRWTVQTAGNPSIRRTRAGDLLVTAGGTVLAIAMDSGAVRWRRALESITAAGPILDAGPALVASGSDLLAMQRVFGIDPQTGEQKWMRKIGEASPMRTGSTVSVPEDAEPVPVLQLLSGPGGRGAVLIETDRNGVRAVDPLAGKVLWDLPAKLPWRIWADGERLFLTYDGAGEAILCLDAGTGKTLWSSSAPSRVHQLEPVDGTVLVTLWKRQLLVLSQADGRRLGWYDLGDPCRLLRGEGGRVILCSPRGAWALEAEAKPEADPRRPETASESAPGKPAAQHLGNAAP